MKDIYSIERRADLRETCIRIDDYIRDEKIIGFNSDFYKLVSRDIKHYDKNFGALNLDDYYDDIGVDVESILDMSCFVSNDECLLYIQSIIAFISFIEYRYYQSQSLSYIKAWGEPLLRMIEYKLELSNYMTIYIKERNEHLIVKRDVSVDSVINQIKDYDTQILLLQYLDFRTANDLEAKKNILAKLYKYYEDPKNGLNGKNQSRAIVKQNSSSKDITPIDAFSEICQHFDVRHFPKSIQKNPDLHPLEDKDTHILCDIAFYMFIEAIRIPEIHKFRMELSKYKKAYKIEDSF